MIQTIDITKDKSEKQADNGSKPQDKYFDPYDFDLDNRPLEPYVPSKQDGWRRVGEGGYQKQIDPAE